MQILSIHLKNIKSHRDTELSFSSGINVLSGPNGAGKSTVFEAIGYAMFGVDAKDFVSNVDRFLTIGTKKGEISVVFRADDGETYRVSRTVGTGVKWLLAKEIGGGFEVEDHARIEETEARVAEILGLDNGRPLAEQFKLVIGPFQNDFLGPFIIKQGTKRKDAFDEILGIDAWRKTEIGTRGLLNAVQKRIEILTAEVEGKQEQLAVLPDKTVELAAIRNDAAGRLKDLKDKEPTLVTMDAQLVQLEAQEKAIAALNGDVQVLNSRITEGNGKIAEQNLRIEESQKALKIVEKSKHGMEAFDKIEACLVELRQKDQQRRVVEKEVVGLEQEALRLSQLLEHERTEIGKAGKQLDAEQEKINTARKELQPDAQMSAAAACVPELRNELEAKRGKRALLDGRRESMLEGKEKLAEGVCPYFQEQCHNIAGTESRDVFSSRIEEQDRQVTELDDQIKELALKLKDAESAEKILNNHTIRLHELDRQADGLEERYIRNRERADGLETITKQLTEAARLVEVRKADLKKSFSDLDVAIAQAEQERLQHQPARDAYTANLNVAQDLEPRLLHLQKMQRLLETLTGEINVKQGELAKKKGGFEPEQLQKVRLDKETLLAEVATLRQQIIDLERNAERLVSEINHLNKIQVEIEAKQVEIKSFKEKEKLVKFLRTQVFKNVSAQLSERFREEISLRADRIYRTIAESDEELNWGDNYQIVLRDMQDGAIRERSDDQLSGGQMMSAVVALRLALLQTIGARVAFFDEPTSNLDAARRENLAQAFRAIDVGREEVTEHWYDQLFLVSHDVAFTEITDKIIEL
ncbi:MAG: SMC family ATPase [Desulfuromonadaceae bacterium]|nr:SMC family ATPase [Desulfuromonadaceae bacterium]